MVFPKKVFGHILGFAIISIPNKLIKLTSYSEIGRPPSSSGFFHLSLHPVLVTSETFRGPSGELGLAVRNE